MEQGRLKAALVSIGFWLAWLLLGAAFLISSPAARFMLAFLTVSCAVVPLAFGDTKRRVGAVIALILGVALTVSLVGRVGQVPYGTKHHGQQSPPVSGQPVGPR